MLAMKTEEIDGAVGENSCSYNTPPKISVFNKPKPKKKPGNSTETKKIKRRQFIAIK